jgi:hypothetical protein
MSSEWTYCVGSFRVRGHFENDTVGGVIETPCEHCRKFAESVVTSENIRGRRISSKKGGDDPVLRFLIKGESSRQKLRQVMRLLHERFVSVKPYENMRMEV